MKIALTIILSICLLLSFSCTKSNDTSKISEHGSAANNLGPSIQANLNTSRLDSTNNETKITNTESVENSFFFERSVLQLNYKGRFLFDDVVEKDIKLHIREEANLKYGKLYELKFDSVEGIPDERLNLGYFYVQEDKIYRLEPNEENLNKLKESEEVPNNSVIVCQDKEIKDTLRENEPGWHQFLEVNGDNREYHSYNNQVETGYYESFTWEKNKGLINYRSGFGAEKDLIELKLSNDFLYNLGGVYKNESYSKKKGLCY